MRPVNRQCPLKTCHFQSLIEQGVIKSAATREDSMIVTSEAEETFTRTGGVDLDTAFRPKFEENLCNNLYCAAISFLLHKMPFVQGISSAHELGQIVSTAIRRAVEVDDAPVFALDVAPPSLDQSSIESSSPTASVPMRSMEQ